MYVYVSFSMEKIELLESVSLFWDLPKEQLGYIANQMIPKKYASGEYFFLEDSEGEQCFFVIHGSVKVTRLSKDDFWELNFNFKDITN